jgi:predicted XRE-type DNA-binding protein
LTDSADRDEVLDALDALLAVLRESAARNKLATRQAQTIRRLRSGGQTYREIFARDERSLIEQSTRHNLLLRASARLRRAEAHALHAEGMTMDKIAALFGVTRQRVSVLLREAAEQEGTLS